jgi:hypothetical protein
MSEKIFSLSSDLSFKSWSSISVFPIKFIERKVAHSFKSFTCHFGRSFRYFGGDPFMVGVVRHLNNIKQWDV